MEILDLTAVELAKKIKAKEITMKEAVEAVLERIEAAEPVVNSYITVEKERALQKAEEIQKQIDEGILTGPLAGVPVAVKDNLCLEGHLTTCGSKILYNFKPTYSSEAVLNLEKSGPREIRITRIMCRVGLPAVPVRRWQPRNASAHWERIPAVLSASPVLSAA